MTLIFTIEKAAAIAGSQTKLAEMLGERRPHISNWKAGTRTCTIDKRIKLAQIAGMDPTTAVLEGLADQLDENDEWQRRAKETLKAILNAFPESKDESQHFRRRRLTRGNHAIPGKARYFFARYVRPTRDEQQSGKHRNDEPWPTCSRRRQT